MDKNITRILALLLVPRLMVGPLTGWHPVITPLALKQSLETPLGLFTCQALAARLTTVPDPEHPGPGNISAQITGSIRAQTDDQLAVARSPRKHKILIAEDNEFTRDNLEGNLREEGFEFTSTANGWAALRHFHAGGYDALITDGHLPGLMGPDLINEIEESDREFPIIFTTGNDEMLLRTRREHPRLVIFPKPYSTAKLLFALRRLLLVRDATAQAALRQAA